ncbi:MAG: nitroreductase family protein [Propionibacteriaceae bacterium]|nr:nitroreductase family protein [Propionibacteriaceae bacterium]
MSTIEELLERKSVRVFEPRPIDQEVKDSILACGFAAPTAGNQMLYSILDIEDPKLKTWLAQSCDHQGFIATAPWVLVFLADCRRWYDAYELAGCNPRTPGVGDFALACQDAMIAAQNMVTAAHAHGLGSCFIGDIMENKEQVVAKLNLDPWVFPATLVVFGYPTDQQKRRSKPRRFAQEFIVHTDQYRRLTPDELQDMFASRGDDFDQFVPGFCDRKYESDFAQEMTRSVTEYLQAYTDQQ